MTVEYVDAGEAIDQGLLSGKTAGRRGRAAGGARTSTTSASSTPASEPQNWLTYYGAYDGQRYSPLDQINTENVKRIGPAWVFQAGSSGIIAGASTYSFEAAPIVVDGIMFLSGWDGWVWALDAKTGTEIWRYKHAVPFDVSLCCGNVNRGVAVAKGKVFFVTANAHVLALDATTGKRVWDKTYGDVRAGESATVAPLVVKNLVIVGQLRRRVRRARPPGRVRRRHRRAPVALLHGPEARRARLGDLARRRRGLGAGRRELLAHRHLRPGDEPAVRGHRQPGARLRRCASARATTSTPTASSPSTSTPARSAGTTSAPRTTCGTTTASPSASCSRRTGASCSGTSTRTATSSSSTARTGNGSRSRRSSTGSPGGRSPGTAR